MAAVLLDTHAWIWTLQASPRLSAAALEAVERSEAVHVSPISFFEIAQKVRIGKWPEMEDTVDELPDLLERQGGLVARMDDRICLDAGLMEWEHRDPFDRLLAATAFSTGMTLVSADVVFDRLSGRPRWPGRIW